MALDQGETVRKETVQQGSARVCIAAQRWEEPGAPRSWEQSRVSTRRLKKGVGGGQRSCQGRAQVCRVLGQGKELEFY